MPHPGHKNIRWLVPLLAIILLGMAATWTLWRAQPLSNTSQQKFDVILVLGTPSLKDGSPSPAQRARVLEGVRAWRQGVAPRLVMSGGAAHNRWVEAHTMALVAEQQGVPASDVFEEGQAQNTIQNVYYTVQIMRAHGWKSADVVSSWDHLPRAALILAHSPILWRTDVAPWPQDSSPLRRCFHEWSEAAYCLKLRLLGFPRSRFISR